MLILPGAAGDKSRMSIKVTVEEGATFVWWAEPIIAAHRCNHCHDVRIALAADARMILREEMLLGRHGETPGDFTNRLRITRDGAALYDQSLSFGPSADGWDVAAVLDEVKQAMSAAQRVEFLMTSRERLQARRRPGAKTSPL